jgi:hypothetical protein
VTRIRFLAEAGDEVPLLVREAAQVGVEKLSRPNAPVEPVYKALERISAELAAESESETDRLIRRSGEVYGRLGETAAHMAISLSHADLSDYVNLARVDPAGVFMITGCVNALCEAAATLIAVQVAASDPTSHSLTDILAAITSQMEEHVFTASETIHTTTSSLNQNNSGSVVSS